MNHRWKTMPFDGDNGVYLVCEKCGVCRHESKDWFWNVPGVDSNVWEFDNPGSCDQVLVKRVMLS
jgi:hypothetical protein